MNYQEETVDINLLIELDALLRKHFEEVGTIKDKRPLDPNYEAYIELNKSGLIKLFTAREGAVLAGYALFFVSPHLRYKRWIYALCDMYYVEPSFRKAGVGAGLFKETEKAFKELGVKSIVVSNRTISPHDKLFEKLGYEQIETTFEKVI